MGECTRRVGGGSSGRKRLSWGRPLAEEVRRLCALLGTVRLPVGTHWCLRCLMITCHCPLTGRTLPAPSCRNAEEMAVALHQEDGVGTAIAVLESMLG